MRKKVAKMYAKILVDIKSEIKKISVATNLTLGSSE